MASVIKDYLSHSSFLGLHYLVDPGLHWTERFFWLVSVLACWVGSVMLMISWMQFAYEHPVSVSVDTGYLDWKTPCPGLVVCEANAPKMLYFKDLMLREKLKQRLFFNYYISEKFVHNNSDRMWLFRDYLDNCSDIFNYCTWQKKEFDCCQYFKPLETAFGTCYAINSIQSDNFSWDTAGHLQREMGELILEFKNPCVKMYAISNDEIVTDMNNPIVIQDKLGIYTEYKIFLSMALTTSDIEIKDIEVERRKCRFPDENYLSVSRNYSYGACKLECQKKTHLKMFNCTHHYMPFIENEYVCNDDQLYNLAQTANLWHMEVEQNCHCDLGCVYNEVRFLGKSFISDRTAKLQKNDTMTYVHINLMASSVRTIRKRTYNMLDNFVNMGGIAGLLVGASLLSIVEIIYFFTIRAIDSAFMERKKHLKPRKNWNQREHERIRVNHPQPIFIEVYPFVN